MKTFILNAFMLLFCGIAFMGLVATASSVVSDQPSYFDTVDDVSIDSEVTKITNSDVITDDYNYRLSSIHDSLSSGGSFSTEGETPVEASNEDDSSGWEMPQWLWITLTCLLAVWEILMRSVPAIKNWAPSEIIYNLLSLIVPNKGPGGGKIKLKETS